jgi:ferrous iron transport protein B
MTPPHEAAAVSPGVAPDAAQARPTCYALLGNPNTGKTTLFNRLCGIRAKTANFPGSTVEARIGTMNLDGRPCQLVDLPGIYGLNLPRPESQTCKDYLAGDVRLGPKPQMEIIVADATNLERNLIFVSQALQQGLPAVVALNMIDLARRRGLEIHIDALEQRLGVPVIPVSARTGEGIESLVAALNDPQSTTATLPDARDALAAHRWAEQTVRACIQTGSEQTSDAETLTDHLDSFFTHPVLGLLSFAAIMALLFYAIFSLAAAPMDWIETGFAFLGERIAAVLPHGALTDLIVNGVIGGISGTIVFVPQICLLFFLISLLEDTGYLARAAFVMDRLLRRFGLPGQSFVPLLSAHACAIPAIMSTRLIPDRRDRIATVLVAPFLSCSARLPVYVLLVGILFTGRPLLAGLAFSGCYLLGAVAALISALIARRTVLKGPSRPMVLELPSYKVPSLRSALLTMIDRGWIFLRKAGTVILGICIVLWWLSAYPKVDATAQVQMLRDRAVAVEKDEPQIAATLQADAEAITAEGGVDDLELSDRGDMLTQRYAASKSFAGRIGRAVEPVFRPIGLDWQITIGVVTSFAAREVFVSTMAVLLAGSEDMEDEGVIARIRAARRDDGSPLFVPATAASLLVFYVLAMQCLPTLAVTARETGHWGWAGLQLGYMTGLAYVLALITHVIVALAGGG